MALTPTAIVIDDSSTIRACLKVGLVKAGFTVVASGGTGEDAIRLYDQHKPTLLMLDIVLPRMDGVSAAAEILRKHPTATVVMCSSLNSRDKILACRALGVANFILKPFTAERIQEVAMGILARNAPEVSGTQPKVSLAQ